MARGDIKYWVFHQEHLDQAIAEFIRQLEADGVPAIEARRSAEMAARFLNSNAGAMLRGGRAG